MKGQKDVYDKAHPRAEVQEPAPEVPPEPKEPPREPSPKSPGHPPEPPRLTRIPGGGTKRKSAQGKRRGKRYKGSGK